MSSEEIEKHYSDGEITVVWRPSRCVHAKRCWKELPSVFIPLRRPWVDMAGAASATIAAQVHRCPSGALSLLGEAPAVRSETPRAAEPARTETRVPARTSIRQNDAATVRREQLIHRLHEAAELEHTIMCTYLYAAFSLRQGAAEGLTPDEAEATARWRRIIIAVAVEEMGHLAAVWNITSALGGSPRFGRANFPTDAGLLPASLVVKLAPFSAAVVQHFIHLERPHGSGEPEGRGFAPALAFLRGSTRDRLTPMAVDYETVGDLYTTIEDELRGFVAARGDELAFCGDPGLQLDGEAVGLDGALTVSSLESALLTLNAIVEQGEGSPRHSDDSHFARFVKIREELAALQKRNPSFEPATPAATNPVLRRPLNAVDRIWIEDEEAARTVDVANAGYALMLRLLAYSYLLQRSSSEKTQVIGLSIELMRAVTLLGERAARLPAGPAHPGDNAGMSFTTLRDAAPLPPGLAARFYFMERFEEISVEASSLDMDDPRAAKAARLAANLAKRASKIFSELV